MTTQPQQEKYQKISSSQIPSSNQQQTSPSQQSSDQIDITNFIQHANNPCIVLFTLLFKVLAILFFLIGGLLNSEALEFILVVILSAFDFWFVKNVSGRILVGLRWWNEIKEDGSEVWIYESDHEKRATSIDTTIFWGSLYLTPIFWIVMTFIKLISVKIMYFLECLIAFILTFSNTVGYYKCSGEQKKKLTSFLATKGQEGFSKIVNYGANAMINQQGGNKV
jgi:hypothetical protein